MPLPFVKMHGLGNDYVYVDGFTHDIPTPEHLAPTIADRHFGVGGDGLILVLPPRDRTDAHCRMRMFNRDGSEGQMCGNGIRCVCKFAHDHVLFPGARDANPMRIDTDNGVLTLAYQLGDDGLVDTVRVDMGEPRLAMPDIPVNPKHATPTDHPYVSKLIIPDFFTVDATFVSTGNPHVVVFAEDANQYEEFDQEMDWLGSNFEHHPAFPEKANAHFVQVRDEHTVDVLHWERGSGETLACGTGASAVCVAGVLTRRTSRKIVAHLPGGPLELEWDETTNHVFMTGPAREVFRGVWP